MTLPSSGPLALSDIQTEFGGSNPIGMNEYYAGGGLVPAGTTGTYGAVPSSGALSVQNFYGTSNYIPVYIEELFSTFTYAGDNSASRTINNGINLSANGGLVWEKARNLDYQHALFDTSRGATKYLQSNSATSEFTQSNSLTGFTTSGYTIGDSTIGNSTGYNYVSWTFRKQPKFFDIVTWTGNGVDGRAIPHNLASAPGCVIIKRTDASYDWQVWHRSMTANPGAGMYLNLTTEQQATYRIYPNPDASNLYVSSGATVNASGGTYVAYLYAHNAGGFGLSGTDNIISCGSYAAISGGSPVVTLGFEPQWIMIKSLGSQGDYGNWGIWDSMRGLAVRANNGSPGNDPLLDANRFIMEGTTYTETGDYISPTATGFIVNPTASNWSINNSGSGNTYIYIAIRKGPMKVPTVGTNVFKGFTLTGTSTSNRFVSTGFPVDTMMSFNLAQNGPYSVGVGDRLRLSNAVLHTSSVDGDRAEDGINFANNTNIIYSNPYTYGPWNFTGVDYVQYAFQRAPKFFDVVCYKGVGTTTTINHNLTIAPQLILIKERTDIGTNWIVYSETIGVTNYLVLNNVSGAVSSSIFGGTAPTSTVFSVGAVSAINAPGYPFIAYLFATCPGVSKVGSYTGTGALQTINCGFAAGSRFILIKRTDSTSGWYVWDSARGISASSDPYFFVNVDQPQVTGTNFVDNTSVGFQVTASASGTVNVSGGTYIFLAIA